MVIVNLFQLSMKKYMTIFSGTWGVMKIVKIQVILVVNS